MNISIIDLLFCSLFCIGLHGSTRKLELWQRLAYNKEGELRSVLFEPLLECLTCMSSLWGSVYFVYISCPYGLFLEYLQILSTGILVLVTVGLIINIKPLLLACYFTLLASFLIDAAYLLESYLIFVLCTAGLNYLADNFLMLARNSRFRV